jgi:hypothetical protein
MKTLKNGFAEIWEVADVLAAAAFGMDMAQAEEADARRVQNLTPEARSTEGLVMAYAARYRIDPILAPTNAELLAHEIKELTRTLIQIAESPNLNVATKAGGTPTPRDRTTKISLSYLRELYASTPDEHHAEYVQALDAAAPFDEHRIDEPRPATGGISQPRQPKAKETADDRQARRYQMCIGANLTMPTNDYAFMPRGIGAVAKREGITRQAFVEDVKAHINRINSK